MVFDSGESFEMMGEGSEEEKGATMLSYLVVQKSLSLCNLALSDHTVTEDSHYFS